MPATVEVAAFVFGLLLVIFAILGQSIKVKDVAVADLSPWQRGVAGALGVALLVIGLNQGRLPHLSAGPVNSGATARITGTPASPTLTCLPAVAVANLLTLPIERSRQVQRSFGEGQPRVEQLVIQFQRDEGLIGGVELRSSAGGAGFDIIRVVNQRCESIDTYQNTTRPSQPANAPYSYDMITYTIDGQIFTVSLAYGAGDGKIWVSSEGKS